MTPEEKAKKMEETLMYEDARFIAEQERLLRMRVYRCEDDTWRVFFEFGHQTSVMDDKVRNFPNEKAANEFADKWWNEWITGQPLKL